MNEKIASILRSRLETLPFVDKLAGLARPMQVDIVGENITKVRKTYPVASDVSFDTLTNGKYKELIPQSKYKSLIYFEDAGSTLQYKDRGRVGFNSRLNLICWLNLPTITCLKTGSYEAILSIISTLPLDHISDGNLREIKITSVSEIPKSPGIFSRYTYDEIKSQYLLYPFDYFALTMSVDYWISLACIEPMNIQPWSKC